MIQRRKINKKKRLLQVLTLGLIASTLMVSCGDTTGSSTPSVTPSGSDSTSVAPTHKTYDNEKKRKSKKL